MISHFLPGRPSRCRTCIFRPDGLQLAPGRLSEITKYLAEGTQHICHSSGEYACRGGRDIQLRVFCARGLISTPTDEALEEANRAYLEGI